MGAGRNEAEEVVRGWLSKLPIVSADPCLMQFSGAPPCCQSGLPFGWPGTMESRGGSKQQLIHRTQGKRGRTTDKDYDQPGLE